MAAHPSRRRATHLPASVAMDRPPRRGEIWSVFTPGQPRDPHQPRPALIISDDVRNRIADDLIVIPIFSEASVGPTHVGLVRGSGGIRRESVLFCEEVTTIHRDFLARGPWGARVEQDLLRRVVRAVRRALGDVVLEP